MIIPIARTIQTNPSILDTMGLERTILTILRCPLSWVEAVLYQSTVKSLVLGFSVRKFPVTCVHNRGASAIQGSGLEGFTLQDFQQWLVQ